MFYAQNIYTSCWPEHFQQDAAFVLALKAYVHHRQHIGRPLSPRASKGLALRLASNSVECVTAALNQSVQNKWYGVYPDNSMNIKNQ